MWSFSCQPVTPQSLKNLSFYYPAFARASSITPIHARRTTVEIILLTISVMAAPSPLEPMIVEDNGSLDVTEGFKYTLSQVSWYSIVQAAAT